MKKLSVFLFCVIVLAACNSLAGNPQSPSPSVTPSTGMELGSTQTPSSGIDSTWKEYSNTQVGFSIWYPANWQEQDLPDENDGQRHHIALQGAEGGIELVWGTGLGGACPEGYQPLTMAKGSLSACHSQKGDGTEMWNLESQTLGNTGFGGFAYTNDTTESSRAMVLQVVSTLSFP